MKQEAEALSHSARRAAQAGDWQTVRSCALQILHRRPGNAEGRFLLGLALKSSGNLPEAMRAFAASLEFDERRYDAAVELAEIHVRVHEFGAAAGLLQRVEALLHGSPKYLNMAGTCYVRIGMPERACPLFRMAADLQPGAASIRANLAEACTFTGRLEEARELYEKLVSEMPAHQRNHYQLSRLVHAGNSSHVQQMLAIAQDTENAPGRNIYLNYAIGKELEDLGRWDEAYRYYRMAGDAARAASRYDVESDMDLIDSIVSICSANWVRRTAAPAMSRRNGPRPVFVVGLPRSGTTLVERILSNHSAVGSVGETLFIPFALSKAASIDAGIRIDRRIIESAAKCEPRRIREIYLDAVSYKLNDNPLFIEKFPENAFYLGFIARAFPDSPVIWLRRNPMDNCFSLFKQSYFRYAYSLDDLGRFFLAFDKLRSHWLSILGDRMYELRYESLVGAQEAETRALLGHLGLPFEAACLSFETNETMSNTASSVQVREAMHDRSVNRWTYFAKHLEPLKVFLEGHGIECE